MKNLRHLLYASTFAVGATAAACQLVAGIEPVPVDGAPSATSENTDDGGPDDAMTTQDSPTEASDDAGKPPEDGSSDGSDPGDGSDSGDGSDASVGFCASHTGHAMCADFDDGAYNAQFSSVGVSANASLGLDSSFSVSPANSLLSRLPTSASHDFAYMIRGFVGNASKITYTFAARPESWPTALGNGAPIAKIVINEGSPNERSVEIDVGSSGSSLLERIFTSGKLSQTEHKLTVALQLAAWRTVAITIDVVQHTCNVTLDGTPVLSNTSLDPSWVAGSLSVHLGLEWATAQPSPWAVRFDNVLVDWQ